MAETTASAIPDASRVIFDAVLYPHRSLNPKGFKVVMSIFGFFSLMLGAFFLSQGAWPIFGFLWLDTLLLYVAFRMNYRSARLFEIVRLTDKTLTVQRVCRRSVRTWTFQPYWLRVSMDDPPKHESMVVLSSHGRSLAIASFLSPDERLDFANALRRALLNYKASFGPMCRD